MRANYEHFSLISMLLLQVFSGDEKSHKAQECHQQVQYHSLVRTCYLSVANYIVRTCRLKMHFVRACVISRVAVIHVDS